MPPRSLRLAGVAFAALLVLSACGTADPATPSPSASSLLSATPPDSSSAIEASPPSPSAGEPSATAEPGASANGATYTVQAGDTLFSIARRYGTTVALLQAWNGARYPALAADADTLQTGWRLMVSGDPSATPLPTPVATTPPATPQPITAPPPVASGCRAGNRVVAGSTQVFRRISSAGHAMALTFDMGGRLDPGVDILNFLIANKVCATLFPTGAMAQTTEGQKIMAIVRAHPELFEAGNHTMHHCDLVRGGLGSPTTAPCAGGAPSAAFIRNELTQAAVIIKAQTGQDPRPYWRPPYGSYSQFVLDAAASVGYTKAFMWDIDTIDWKPISQGGPTGAQIASKVINAAQDGSNVLMHLGGYETLNALNSMVPGLRDRGFLLTSLSDLLN